jgi:hypothetical protein
MTCLACTTLLSAASETLRIYIDLMTSICALLLPVRFKQRLPDRARLAERGSTERSSPHQKSAPSDLSRHYRCSVFEQIRRRTHPQLLHWIHPMRPAETCANRSLNRILLHASPTPQRRQMPHEREQTTTSHRRRRTEPKIIL